MTWREELRRLLATVDEGELLDLVAELRRAELEAEIRARGGLSPSAPPRAYTAAEVADLLHRNVSWVRRHSDLLGAVKADGAVLYPESRLRRFLDGRR